MGPRAGAVLGVVCAGLAWGPSSGGAAAGDNKLPANPAEALAAAMPMVEAARTAKSAEPPEVAKGIRRAVDLMQPHVTKGAKDDAWAAVWNEALTLSRFHGNKPTGEYAMTPSKAVGGIVVGLPTGRNWAWEPGRFGPNVQCYGEFRRRLADGRTGAAVRVSIYSFNVVYSDVGGENAAGLAEIFFEIHRDSMAKVESRSPKVVAKPLSPDFKRANFFEVVGTIKDEGRARIRGYFVKTSTRTYEFDAIEYRDAKETDSPLDVWQTGTQDPELEAVLASIAEEKK